MLTPVLVAMLIFVIQRPFGPEASAPPATPTPSRPAEPPIVVDLVSVETDAIPRDPTRALRDPVHLDGGQLAALNAMTEEQAEAWFRRQGVAEDSLIKVVLRGNNDKKVRIVNMVADATCGPPFSGTLFYSPPGGADDDIIKLGFDLDTPTPRAQLLEGWAWRGDYFTKKTISLARDEDITLLLVPETSEHYAYERAYDEHISGSGDD
ncbi:hypothetical protein HNP84_005883 [Thermocatellispora tengchongensis]|uniref:Uncharacterized protein n=1 Tax=Thermocatellispora tengchongensis TaxID=1073253 RepID=A0A840PAV7_9ACTN|nr:hypothetical protein [Thermocatellispora tengchongensis]MBB5136139.1 hypothetical protein [Thermocatellispora tengchongensis]